MLLSVVLDAYTRDAAKEVLAAVHDLFRPDVSSGWAAVGLYAYWNPDSHELLYVGLARDLGNRFAQHNGLMSCPAKACKREQIRDYFENHDVLGFSVIAQSAYLQGMGERFPEDVYNVMQNGEGHLIQAHVDATGAKPVWNRVGGSSVGQAMNVEHPSTMCEIVTNARDSLLVARRTLRLLSAEPTSEWFEHTLHTARMHATEEALMGGVDANVLHWLERLRDEPRYGADRDTIERIIASDYLRQRALPPTPTPHRPQDQV